MADEPSTSVDPSINVERLGLITLAAAALCVIPVGGSVLCFVLAGYLNTRVKRHRQRLSKYVTDDPITPVADAAVGSVVRVVGRVEPVALIDGPLSGVKVPFAKLVVHRETTGKQTYMTHAFTEDYGETITLRDETGIAVVATEGMDLGAKHVTNDDHYGPLQPGVVRDAVMKHIPQFVTDRLKLKLAERAVRVGDELSVTARVEQSEQAVATDERGYREGGAEQRIIMGPRDDGTLLASTFDRADLAAIEGNVATLRTAAFVVIAVGIAGLAAWLLYLHSTIG